MCVYIYGFYTDFLNHHIQLFVAFYLSKIYAINALILIFCDGYLKISFIVLNVEKKFSLF